MKWHSCFATQHSTLSASCGRHVLDTKCSITALQQCHSWHGDSWLRHTQIALRLPWGCIPASHKSPERNGNPQHILLGVTTGAFTIGSCPLKFHQVAHKVLLNILEHSCNSCTHVLLALTARLGSFAKPVHQTPAAKLTSVVRLCPAVIQLCSTSCNVVQCDNHLQSNCTIMYCILLSSNGCCTDWVMGACDKWQLS